MNREYFYLVLPKFSCYSVAPTLPFLFSHFSCICPGPTGAPDLCSVSVCVCMHVSHVVHISRKVRTAELEKRKSGRKSLKVNYFFYFKKRYTQTTHTHAHTQASCTCHINKQSNICKLTAWACCPLLCSTPFSPPENSFTEHVCVCVCVFSTVNEAPCSLNTVPPSVSEPASPPPSYSAGRSEPLQRCLFLFMFIASSHILALVLSPLLEAAQLGFFLSFLPASFLWIRFSRLPLERNPGVMIHHWSFETKIHPLEPCNHK